MKQSFIILTMLIVVCTCSNVTLHAQSWSLTGNAGTTSSNFIGTTDAQPLHFKSQGSPAGILNLSLGNTAFGPNSLFKNSTGSSNTAIGSYALFSGTVASYNTAVGNDALLGATGSNNTGIGFNALLVNSTGASNTALGYSAGQSITTGSGNIAIGAGAQVPTATGSKQLSIGNWIYGNNGNISIGTTAANQQLTVNAGMNIDQAAANGNSLKNALTFGNSGGTMSGEGIASNRTNTTAGANEFGLDFYTNYTKRMYVSNNGNAGFVNSVSIGTTAVNQQLTVNTGMNIDEASANGNTLKNALTFGNSSGAMSGEGIASNRSNNATGTNKNGLDFYTDYTNRMSISNTGNVGIGIADPSNKLDVCGTIRAKEVLVSTGWCDYVFEKDYNLRPLAEVQQFVEQNKHLPDVPSAGEIESNGVKVAQMDSIMIKKIEELTLYLVQQNKQIEQLQQKVGQLEQQNADLKKDSQ